jgi:23S rRNA pseudouridine2605 synthase
MQHFRRNDRLDSSEPRTGLARALSKLGLCSRSQGRIWIQAGRVRVNGGIVRHPEKRVSTGRDRIEVDGQGVRAKAKVYLMLNKPRGLVTTASDEHGRATVFACLNPAPASGRQSREESPPGRAPEARAALPRVFPVGRLDKASEGLLLFTNDTAWAAQITDSESLLEKTYHVRVDCVADEALARRLERGVSAAGEFLSAKRAAVLRHGEKNSWLEIILDEGRNRHIRRLLEALGVRVLRLIRVAIGPLQLGTLAKGAFRPLAKPEARALATTGRPPDNGSPETADGRKPI